MPRRNREASVASERRALEAFRRSELDDQPGRGGGCTEGFQSSVGAIPFMPGQAGLARAWITELLSMSSPD